MFEHTTCVLPKFDTVTTIDDLRRFLYANGQDPMAFDIFDEALHHTNVPEDFASSLVSLSHGAELAKGQGISWETLQNRTITVDGRKHKNPWPHRLGYGGRDASPWQNHVRKKGVHIIFFHL